MTDVKDILKVLCQLKWHPYQEPPIARHKIVAIFDDGNVMCDTAIVFEFSWGKVERWVYLSEIIELSEKL